MDNDDRASIITQDKLKKFNEIYGFDHGPAVEGEEENEDEQFREEEQSNPNEGEEIKDEVHSLASKAIGPKSSAVRSKLTKS